MIRSYTLLPSEDKLINLSKASKRLTRRPKSDVMDIAQRAYLSYKDTYGWNAPVRTELYLKEIKKQGGSQTAYINNFCGIEGLLQRSEAIVLRRVEYVVSRYAKENLTFILRACLDALFRANSPFVARKSDAKDFNMQLRTELAFRCFGEDYWHAVAGLFKIAFDATQEENHIWKAATETDKELLLRELVPEFKTSIGILLEENIGRWRDGNMIFDTRIKTQAEKIYNIYAYKISRLGSMILTETRIVEDARQNRKG